MNIDNLIKEALLERNTNKKEAYRAIKAEILLLQTSKNAKPVSDIEIFKTIRKIISQKEESISMYESANKPDMQNRKELVDSYKEQIKYLKELLPPEISKEDIEKAFKENYPEGVSKKEMGLAIKAIKDIYPSADGKIIADIVKNNIK